MERVEGRVQQKRVIESMGGVRGVWGGMEKDGEKLQDVYQQRILNSASRFLDRKAGCLGTYDNAVPLPVHIRHVHMYVYTVKIW